MAKIFTSLNNAVDTPRVQSEVYPARGVCVRRLFAFPHGGGGSTTYRHWSNGLSDQTEVVSFSLPGRALQGGSVFIQDWDALIEGVLDALFPHFDGMPFAFFGHSFGALVAFEACRELRRRKAELPFCLFLSAHRAAHLTNAPGMPNRQTHALPHDSFIEATRSWGFFPEAALADSALMALVLPPLRADLRLDEIYQFKADEPLQIKCVAYGGLNDHSVSKNEIEAWHQHIAPDTSFDLQMFESGHFYAADVERALLDSMEQHMGIALAARNPSIVWGGQADFMRCRVGHGGGRVAGELSVPDLFSLQVERTPHAMALEDGERRWTYRELDRAVSVLAERQKTDGVRSGSVVGIFLPHCAEYLITLLSTLSLGAVACLLEKNWSGSLLTEFIHSCDVALIVTQEELVHRLLPETHHARVIILQSDWLTDACHSTDRALVKIKPDDIALISMTSGSTGKPKAVLSNHAKNTVKCS